MAMEPLPKGRFPMPLGGTRLIQRRSQLVLGALFCLFVGEDVLNDILKAIATP